VGAFGERLKRERERRAITLDEISLSTKIGTRLLRALEEEKFDQLPGGIFNKGFVRAYARHLGIDEEQAVADYLEAAGESPPAKIVEAPEESYPLEVHEERERRGAGNGVARIPWGVLAIALLIVALGLAVWGFYTRGDQAGPKKAPEAVPSQKGKAAEAGSMPSSTAPPELGSQPRRGASPEAAKRGSAAVPPAPPAQVAATGMLVPGSFTVLIHAREDSWIAVTADGTKIMEDTLVAAGEKSVAARKEIVVKAGNVGGLDFIFNGRKLPVQGDYGEVKTLTFEPSGLQPPAPKPPG
jgi:cytoskeleton protein RodZ